MGRRRLEDIVLLFEKAPHLKGEWDYDQNEGIAPEKLSSGSGVNAWWKCPKGHEWRAKVWTRAERGSGCNKCLTATKIAKSAAKNPLSANEKIASQLDDPRYTASDLSMSSSQKVWWKCDKGHRWEYIVSQMVSSQSGCLICNSLEALRPDLAAQWDEDTLSPAEVRVSSGKKVRWKCEIGHTWVAVINDRNHSRTKGNGCPYCPGARGQHAKVLPGVNDLATLYPEIAAELHTSSVSASELRPFVNTKLEWKCSQGHVWAAQVASRTKSGSGCPSCALVRTSKVEKRLRNLVSEHERSENTVLEDSYRLSVPFRRNKTMTVDVYCQWSGLPVVVEYDGAYWHHSEANISRDTDKTSALLEHDYLVVRFRENKLPHLELSHKNLLQINVQYDKDEDTSLEEAISKMEEWLNDR